MWTLVCLLTGGLAMTASGNAIGHDTPRARADSSGDPLPDGALARLGTLRWRHSQPVNFVAFLPDGKAVLTGDDDRTLRLWDRATGKEIRRFVLPPERPQGKDRVVRAFRMSSQGMVAALSDDAKTLAAVSYNPIVLWHVPTGEKIREIEAPTTNPIAVAISPDGKVLALRGAEQSLFVLATDTGKPIGPVPEEKRLRGGPFFNGDFNTVAFSPDGKLLAYKDTDVKPPATPFPKTFIVVHEVATGKELWRQDATGMGTPMLTFAPDGKFVAVTRAEMRAPKSAIEIYNANNGQLVRRFDTPSNFTRALRFTPDSKWLLTTNGPLNSLISVWDVDTGKKLHQLGERTPYFGGARVGLAERVLSPAVSADGKTVLAAFHNTLRMWNLETAKEMLLAGGHRTAVAGVAVTRDGKQAVSHGNDGIVRIWDLASGREVGHYANPKLTRAIAYARDGRTLAFGHNGGAIDIVDAQTGKPQLETEPGDFLLETLIYSPDAKMLAVLPWPATSIILCDAATGDERRKIMLPGAPAAKKPFKGPRRVPGEPTDLSVVFSPDSKTLIGHFADNGPSSFTGGGVPIEQPRAKNTLRFWDVATGNELRKLELAATLGNGSVALAPDGRVLACENDDGTVSLWELASAKERLRVGKAVNSKPPPRSEMAANQGLQARTAAHTVGFSPDGRLVAFGGPGHTVRVWDADAGTEVGAFTGHYGAITTLAFSPDSRRLITGSTDTTLLVWDMAALRRPASLPKLDLSVKAQSELWSDLAADDPGKAFFAIRRLAASPQQAVPHLREKTKAAVPVDPKAIERLIAQLNSDNFEERSSAIEALIQLGDLVVPPLRKVAAGQPTLETRRRVEQLLMRLTTGSLPPEHLRVVRAIEVLERATMPEARQALQELAKGAPEALVTREALAALDRLR
jgi:WD40 repeat protein